jgi:acyl-CoA synthetase (AMP-forming)/AMP-acid ligase II
LISVPLFHVTACNSQLLVAARVGGTSVILPAFHQAKMIASVPGERITFIVSVPAIYSLILRRPEFATTDVSAVRWVGYGGAPIAPALAVSSIEVESALLAAPGVAEAAVVLKAQLRKSVEWGAPL